ncbi:MAG: cytochrome c [Myxococcota bacterium]
MLRLASTAFAVIALAGCTEPAPPAPLPPRVLGGVEVSGQTLATGRRAYKAVCESCHGAAGDGRGRLGVRQNPKPRDFAKGVIKFASVPAGELWVDDDVLRTLRHGLAGTQMIAIKLPEEDLRAVTQYIKTFSPSWARS